MIKGWGWSRHRRQSSACTKRQLPPAFPDVGSGIQAAGSAEPSGMAQRGWREAASAAFRLAAAGPMLLAERDGSSAAGAAADVLVMTRNSSGRALGIWISQQRAPMRSRVWSLWSSLVTDRSRVMGLWCSRGCLVLQKPRGHLFGSKVQGFVLQLGQSVL